MDSRDTSFVPASITIVPFSALPSCVRSCGPLYDANDNCVPPTATEASEAVYEECFCHYPGLAPLSTGLLGVCDAICTTNLNYLLSLHTWFTDFCGDISSTRTTGSTLATTGPGVSTTSATDSRFGESDFNTLRLPKGAIIGIAIGSAFVVACVIASTWRMIRQHKARSQERREKATVSGNLISSENGAPNSAKAELPANSIGTVLPRQELAVTPGPGQSASHDETTHSPMPEPQLTLYELDGGKPVIGSTMSNKR